MKKIDPQNLRPLFNKAAGLSLVALALSSGVAAAAEEAPGLVETLCMPATYRESVSFLPAGTVLVEGKEWVKEMLAQISKSRLALPLLNFAAREDLMLCDASAMNEEGLIAWSPAAEQDFLMVSPLKSDPIVSPAGDVLSLVAILSQFQNKYREVSRLLPSIDFDFESALRVYHLGEQLRLTNTAVILSEIAEASGDSYGQETIAVLRAREADNEEFSPIAHIMETWAVARMENPENTINGVGFRRALETSFTVVSDAWKLDSIQQVLAIYESAKTDGRPSPAGAGRLHFSPKILSVFGPWPADAPNPLTLPGEKDIRTDKAYLPTTNIPADWAQRIASIQSWLKESPPALPPQAYGMPKLSA